MNQSIQDMQWLTQAAGQQSDAVGMAYQYPRRRPGFSIVELLIALTITSMLMAATMVAIDASFYAYASAAEQASSQATTRMVTHRIITMVRTSTAHGPLLPDTTVTPNVTISDDILTSPYIELIDAQGNLVRLEYNTETDELWATINPFDGTPEYSEPVIGGVTNCVFTLKRRTDDQGVLVLERATMDLTVQPGQDTSLAIENGSAPPVRMIASTMPRRLN